MAARENYHINFSSLKNGTHRFDYLIEHPFFAKFEYSPVKEGRVWVNISLSKHETMMVLDFSIKGTVNVPCDRCLEYFDLPIEGNQKLVVKFGETTEEQTDEILILSHAEYELDVSQYIYEFILLNVPIRMEHPEDTKGNSTCNPNAMDLLEKMSRKQESQEADPRWDVLKKLKGKVR